MAAIDSAASAESPKGGALLGGAAGDRHLMESTRQRADQLMKHACLHVIESPHPYLPNTEEQIVVSVPGATFLTVTFDENWCVSVVQHFFIVVSCQLRSNTERDRDFVGLYRGRGRNDQLMPLVSGRGEAWPRVPVVCQGDTLTARAAGLHAGLLVRDLPGRSTATNAFNTHTPPVRHSTGPNDHLLHTIRLDR